MLIVPYIQHILVQNNQPLTTCPHHYFRVPHQIRHYLTKGDLYRSVAAGLSSPPALPPSDSCAPSMSTAPESCCPLAVICPSRELSPPELLSRWLRSYRCTPHSDTFTWDYKLDGKYCAGILSEHLFLMKEKKSLAGIQRFGDFRSFLLNQSLMTEQGPCLFPRNTDFQASRWLVFYFQWLDTYICLLRGRYRKIPLR